MTVKKNRSVSDLSLSLTSFMSVTTAACVSLYDAMCTRSGGSADADRKAVAALHRAMVRAGDAERPVRYQAQLVLTPARRGDSDDACVLAVVDSAVYNRLLAYMMDWHSGLAGIRSAKFQAAPLMLPTCFQRDRSLALLNACFGDIHACVAAGSEDGASRPAALPASDAAWREFVGRVLRNLARIQLPAAHRPLSVVRPSAPVGSLVIWTGWHGSFAALESGTPAVAAFVDYGPRDVWSAEQRAASHRLLSTVPWEFGAGSHACRHAGFNDANNRAHGREGGLARLPDDARTPLVNWLAGDDSAVADVDALPLAAILTPEQVAAVHADGFLVVPATQLRSAFPQWDAWVREALVALSEHINDTLTTAGSVGDALRKRPFSLVSDDDDDARFEALGGTQDAARRHFGSPYAMYRHGSRDARNGGSLLTAQSGMGAATNLYDSPGHVRMQTALWPLFAQLYQTRNLLWVPERMRVRTAGGELPLHTDTSVAL